MNAANFGSRQPLDSLKATVVLKSKAFRADSDSQNHHADIG
jgi:hypothetical protein